ncbi:MAG: cation-translocating P-type ATPase [Gammaproteobacteria bacterium]|nr:cation-translocating P-type ATPase [Gammaproteobacteria bacterium]
MNVGQCFHCDAPLPATVDHVAVVDGQQRSFCGPDCQQVAELIAKRGLTGFYQFRDGPTESAASRDTRTGRWASYDRAALQREFVTTDADGSKNAQLLLQGVRCAACSWLIENALGSTAGVQAVRVDPVTTRTSLSWNPRKVQLSELLQQLARLGYTPFPYTEDATEQAATVERRVALKRLILAGLGMMQVMSFAVALYMGAWRDAEIEEFLRLISLVVATPVVFYSGAPFFVGAWHRLRARSLGMDVPVALAIGGAWAASVWNTFTGGGEVYFDSATMFVFFLSAARFLEMAGRHRALSLTGALARHLPRVATRLVDGQLQEVGVIELRPGDRVLVQPGRAVPADGVLETTAAHVDESLLTGESRSIEKQCGETVVAGSIAQTEALQFTVTRVGADTVMAQIARLVGDAGSRKPKLVEVADRIAGYFVGAVLIAALIVGVIWWQLAPERAFEVVLAVLVVTCPCALALATPAAFTVASSALARAGFMVRRAGALQVLAQVTDVVFDKTGTLTSHAAGIESIQTTGELDEQACLSIAAALEAQSEHPLARAFPAPRQGLTAADVRAVPGAGLTGRVNGQVWRIGSLEFVTGPDVDAAAALGDEGEDARLVYLAGEAGVVAVFRIAEQLRDGSAAAVAALGGLGLRNRIASGDRAGPVKSLATRLGIERWRAGMKPDDKLAYVKALQDQNHIVAMLGDGINDSPVLAGADVSIAMGSGTSLAQHSADCVLMSTSLASLPAAISKARATMRVVRQNLAWAVGYNLVALPLAATGVLAPWMAALGMSASSLLVTANALRLGRRSQPTTTPGAGSESRHVDSTPREQAACCKKTAGVAAP